MLSDSNVQAQLPVALVGLMTLISPYITAFFTRASMSPKAKHGIAIAVSAVIAIVYVVLNGGVDSWEKLFVAVPVVYGVGQALYGLLMRDSAKVVEATKGLTDAAAPAETVNVDETPAAAAQLAEDAPKHRAEG